MEFLDWSTWLESGLILIGAVVIALVAHAIFFAIARRWSRSTPMVIDNAAVEHGARPARAIVVIWALFLAMPVTPIETVHEGTIRHILGLGIIAAVAWLLNSLLDVIDDVTQARFDTEVEDNLQARRVRTQVRLLRRIMRFIIIIAAIAVMLMTFPSVRRIGEGLFASAGIAALIAGLAVRPTLSNLIAGIQLALTEPIRINDVVIVEGEWGHIEEIGLTYVVVRIWDLRRLIVPISYFLEQPFQNWTRQTANLLGAVYLYTDYNVPVEDVRQKLHEVLEESGMWDGNVWALQVTDSNDQSVELRALMSAPNSSVAWDLRCHVRERLIAYLQEHYPDSLPRTRAEISGPALPDGARAG